MIQESCGIHFVKYGKPTVIHPAKGTEYLHIWGIPYDRHILNGRFVSGSGEIIDQMNRHKVGDLMLPHIVHHPVNLIMIQYCRILLLRIFCHFIAKPGQRMDDIFRFRHSIDI